MNEKLACPSSNVLSDLIDGKIVEPELSEYSLHLEECSFCQEKARSMSPGDTLIESLRGTAPAADTMASAVPRPLIERLKQIPSSESKVWSDSSGRSRDPAALPHEQLFNFLAPAQQADEIGRLGHYRIHQVLGQGGMGTVFLAEDPKLGRQVALKVMLPRLAADPTAKDRFLREARAAARLKNDHIVTIYEVGETRGLPYLAMEVLEGESLADGLRAGQSLPIAQVIHIARDIACGLADAHAKGFIHRDIKPGNLWLERLPDGRVRAKILDFGLVLAGHDDVHMTQLGALVGTPAFMAPEQARGDKTVDGRADLFSLGCVLYLLCTGEVPFQSETTIGTLMALAMHVPVAPVERNDSVPPELSQLILQLLEKSPDRRPQSARDVIARLTEIERSSPLKSSQRPRHRILLLVGLAFAALLIVSATIVFWQTPDGHVVRIECNDPAIEIAFNDGELKVTGAYKEPIMLKPGKANLRIAKKGVAGDDFEFQTDKLIVNKGDRIVLKIEFVDGQVRLVQVGQGVLDSKALSLAPEEAVDFDRQAADWVLAIGGKVEIDDHRWIELAEDERPIEPFYVTSINLVLNEKVTDAGLKHCRGLRRLRSLDLDSTGITDAGLAHLEGCKNLKSLLLYGTKVTDAGLIHLRNLKQLQELGLGGGTQVTDAGLQHLVDLEKLTTLYLDATQVTDASLPLLKTLPDLVRLNLSCTNVTSEGLTQLKHFTGLTEICLLRTPTTDDTLLHLKSLRALSILNLDGTSVTDAGLDHLKSHRGLTMLYVRNTQVSPKAVAEFHAQIPGCRIFHDGGILEAKE